MLIQAIVDMNRANELIPWHGTSVSIPIPAGVATNSPWLDISHSSEAYYGSRPVTFDYLEGLDTMGRERLSPCAQWPASPPRKYLYAADDLISHPYVSPVTRSSWAGFPPVYICTGWERLAYEDKFLAAKLWRDGVAVTFEEYEGMPHCFVLAVTTPEAERCMNGWTGFISKAVEDPRGLQATAVTVSARTLEERPWAFLDISDVSEDEVRRRIVDKVADTKVVATLSRL